MDSFSGCSPFENPVSHTLSFLFVSFIDKGGTGVNYQAQPLQLHERETIRNDPKMKERVITSYRLMLDFYGMRLEDVDTGLLSRSEPSTKSLSRYRNLVRKSPFLV